MGDGTHVPDYPDAPARVTFYFTDENSSGGIDGLDEAMEMADEKAVLFFSYKVVGFGVDERYYMRPSILHRWTRATFDEFREALKAHREIQNARGM